MATDIPMDIPLQQQTEAFFAQAKSQVPADLFKDLLSPVEQLITSGAAEKVLKEGIIFALLLLALSLIQLLTGRMRLLGASGIVYTLILTAFAFTQTGLLEGPMHWLIQTAHVVIGFGALALVQVISVRDARLRRSAATVPVPRATVPRASAIILFTRDAGLSGERDRPNAYAQCTVARGEGSLRDSVPSSDAPRS